MALENHLQEAQGLKVFFWNVLEPVIWSESVSGFSGDWSSGHNYNAYGDYAYLNRGAKGTVRFNFFNSHSQTVFVVGIKDFLSVSKIGSVTTETWS